MTMMMKILEDLTPLNRVFCSNDYDRAVQYLCQLLPFRIIEYSAAEEHNGWVIPPKWEVKEAKIIRDGSVIYDGTIHPLAVIALSTRFRGTVNREELRAHLHYDHRYDDAVPFHFRQEYRSWERTWGFCVPKTFYDGLAPGEYEVVIETEEAPGALKLLEYTHKGMLDETIVFMAHLDHPGMANDGLAGCAVGVELFRRLLQRETKFSYRLFIHQEMIGSEYYLAHLSTAERNRLIEGVFLQMLGSKTELALQASYASDTGIEFAIGNALRRSGIPHRRGRYEEIVACGEYIWRSYGIPVASLSRFPYPEYHTNWDDFSLLSQDALDEALGILTKAVEELESSPVLVKRFEGTLCLSNPKYNLYVDPGQAAFGGFIQERHVKGLRELMDLIPSLRHATPVAWLASWVGLDQQIVLAYLGEWAQKGLILLL